MHCFRYIKQKEDAEEILSDGFIKVFNKLKEFEYYNDKSFEAWIKRIMINESLMFLRKRKIIFLDEDNALKMESLNTTDSEFEAEDIYNLILSLPTGYRTIFNLFAIEGYSHGEISQMLQISDGTSRSQLTKARVMLKAKMDKSNSNGRI